MKKTITIFLLAFIILISSPTLFLKVSKINVFFHINENRNLQKFPKITNPIAIRTNFTCIESWYNDRFAFRDFLIRLQHQIDYSLFNYSKEICIDKNKFLYYKTVTEREQIYNEYSVMNNEEDSLLVQTCNIFNEIKNFLNQKDISLKILIPPQKNEVIANSSIYLNVSRPEKNAYLKMEEYYNNNGLQKVYVPVLDILKSKNLTLPVFYRNDFHWNDYGAAIAFTEVINSYANDKGFDNVLDIEKDFYLDTLKEAKINNQLDNLSTLFYKDTYSITAKNNKGIVYTPATCDITNWSCWENHINPVFKGAVLFIGDSYTPPALYDFNGTYSGISGIFEKTYFCHWDYSKGVLNNIPSDVVLVVIERIESQQFSYSLFYNLLK